MKQRLHPVEILLMLTAALLLTSGAVALHTQSELADKVVRLHVLANSDSGEDQALKLKVRDAVLAQASETLRGRYRQGRSLPAADSTAAGIGKRRRGRSLRPTDMLTASGWNWRRRRFPPKPMMALLCLPGNIWRFGCSSGKRQGRTGGAWCFRRCVPQQPATFQRWRWTPG